MKLILILLVTILRVNAKLVVCQSDEDCGLGVRCIKEWGFCERFGFHQRDCRYNKALCKSDEKCVPKCWGGMDCGYGCLHNPNKEEGCLSSSDCKWNQEFCAEIDGKNKCVKVVDIEEFECWRQGDK
eukprot:08629.XXX_491383_490889_1 [CDS] Oithona nana genome sequencing.